MISPLLTVRKREYGVPVWNLRQTIRINADILILANLCLGLLQIEVLLTIDFVARNVINFLSSLAPVRMHI